VNPTDVLFKVIDVFEKYKIEYMIAGSIASNLYGVPRTTFDADIVIKTDLDGLKKFIDDIKDDFYVDVESPKEVIENRRIFNIIHYKSGFKIDIVPIRKRTFSEVEFARRREIEFMNRKIWFSSPEDTILTKLEWAKMGESERQFNDALAIVRVQMGKLDWDYLQEWAEKLEVSQLLQKIQQKIKEDNV